MTESYTAYSALEIVPLDGDRLELRAPLFGTRLEATRDQVGLLRRFEDRATLAEVLAGLPVERESSARFLAACVEAGILLPLDARDELRLPARSRAEPTLLGAPHFDPARPAAFTFLGVPWDGGATGHGGGRFGPGAIRSAGTEVRYQLDPETLRPRGFLDFASGETLLRGITLADAGDLLISPGEPAERVHRRLAAEVAAIVRSGSIPLVLGGDHSITLPVLRAIPPRRLGVVHLDAHTDLGDQAPGAGLHHANVMRLALDELGHLEGLWQAGLRGLVEATDDQWHERAVAFGIDRLRAGGTSAFIDALPADLSYYVSIDIDALDPLFAPSTGTPVPGGLWPHEAKALVRAIAEARPVVAADMVEVGAQSSLHDNTGHHALELLLTLADATVRRLNAHLDRAETGG